MLASSPQDEARGVKSVGVSGWDPRRGSGGTYLLEKLHVLLSLYFHGTRRSDQQHEAADNSHLQTNEVYSSFFVVSFLFITRLSPRE